MKRLFLFACAIIVVALPLWAAGASDTPPAPQADYQDLIYFGESRPVLLRLHVTVEGQPLSAHWDDLVDKVFKYLDVKGNGYVGRNEIARVPSPAVLFGGSFEAGEPMLSQLDTNGDGKVSRSELAVYYRRLGATPFQVGGGRMLADERLLYELRLREALELEILAREGGARVTGNTDAVNDALFKLLDTNGDGKLSKEELAAAPAVLLKRDRNDDEVITPDEIVPGVRVRGRFYEKEEIVAEIELLNAAEELSDYNRLPGKGPFWHVQPGASRAELARRLLGQYSKNAKKGHPPAMLSSTDLGLEEASFAKLDVDGNGWLDSEELGRFAERSPDLELNVDLGPKASITVVKRGAPLEANVHPGRDGALMLEIAGNRLDLKCLVEPRVDAAASAKNERELYLADFKKADRDNNGYLDMAEAMRSELFSSTFKLMDRDGDGMLFEKEVLAYLDTYQDLRATARTACATVGISSEGKGLFELIDTDGDGRLSVRELRNAVKLIAELDRDGDGMVSRNEIPRCSQATFRLGPAAGDGRHAARSYSYSGWIGRRQQPAKPARGPEWFRKMDRNGDGDVSRREFLGTDAQFKAIDTDGDGLIGVEEAEAYDKKLRDAAEKK